MYIKIKKETLVNYLGLRKKLSKELEGVNIDEEYKLIQQKKSNLSKRLRDKVVYLYNNKQEIENDSF